MNCVKWLPISFRRRQLAFERAIVNSCLQSRDVRVLEWCHSCHSDGYSHGVLVPAVRGARYQCKRCTLQERLAVTSFCVVSFRHPMRLQSKLMLASVDKKQAHRSPHSPQSKQGHSMNYGESPADHLSTQPQEGLTPQHAVTWPSSPCKVAQGRLS